MFLLVAGCSDYDLAMEKPAGEPERRAFDSAPEVDSGADEDAPVDTGQEEEPPSEGFDPDDPGEETPYGNVVTILLTMSDDFVPETQARDIVNNAVAFVSPARQPNVLVIRDDAAGSENAEDSEYITTWIDQHGWTATLLEEPSAGVAVADLAGYDAVILSNPGKPPDDHATIDAMRRFSQQGYGIIFQGDDMTRFADDSDAMEELTRLRNIDNGTSYYGFPVDNDDGIFTYAVELDPGTPISDTMGDLTFTYGNDIDTAEPTTGTNDVVAWCTIKDSDLPLKPVITAYMP